MDELITIIDNHPKVDASGSGSIITITYFEEGTDGNTFMVTSSNPSQIAMLTGPFLSDGSDRQTESTTYTVQTGATGNGNITVKVDGVPHTVGVTAGLLPDQVAARIAMKLNADVVPGYVVTSTPFSPTITFTSTTPNSDVSPNLTVSIE